MTNTDRHLFFWTTRPRQSIASNFVFQIIEPTPPLSWDSFLSLTYTPTIFSTSSCEWLSSGFSVREYIMYFRSVSWSIRFELELSPLFAPPRSSYTLRGAESDSVVRVAGSRYRSGCERTCDDSRVSDGVFYNHKEQRTWELTTNLARRSSAAGSTTSLRTHRTSNLDAGAGGIH